VPDAIRRRKPTTDTHRSNNRREFYFGLSLEQTDLCIYAHDHGIAAAEAAPVVGLTAEQVSRAFGVIDAKREAARYLHATALLAGLEYGG
jgi:NAD+ synthase